MMASNYPNGSSRFSHLKKISNDLDNEVGSVEFATYTVQIPSTPDNQLTGINLQRSTSQRVEDQSASSSLFTGGYNCVTRAQLKDKVIESETSHPQMTWAKGSYCTVPGCGAQVVNDERGLDIVPCECGYKICMECYRDAMRNGESICLGCQEPYKEMDMNEYGVTMRKQRLSADGMSKTDRRMLLMKSKSTKSKQLVESQAIEMDQNQWLFENAMWPKKDVSGGLDGMRVDPKIFKDKKWKPLTREVSISAATLSPYR